MIARLFFSLLLFVILLVSSVLFYIDYGPVKMIPILRYEHINESESKLSEYVHPESFKNQMKFLSDDKFTVIPMEKVIEIYRKKEKIPRHTVAITFDGGYDDFNNFAFGILQKYKFPATVFLQSGNMGKKGYMTKETILKLVPNGLIHFGSNGQTGRNLLELNGADASGEIFSSRTYLEKELEIPIDYFSYANGGVNPFLMQKVRESGYKGACALIPGKKYPNNDSFVMKRTPIFYRDENPIYFKLKSWGNYVFWNEWWRERKKSSKAT